MLEPHTYITSKCHVTKGVSQSQIEVVKVIASERVSTRDRSEVQTWMAVATAGSGCVVCSSGCALAWTGGAGSIGVGVEEGTEAAGTGAASLVAGAPSTAAAATGAGGSAKSHARGTIAAGMIHDALARVRVLDGPPLEVDVLRDVAHEGEDLRDAVVRDGHRREEVDDRVRDRRRVREVRERRRGEHDLEAPPVCPAVSPRE
jgi:hypothetical protein